jgi:DNA-binding NarL/FixJ family response regulator
MIRIIITDDHKIIRDGIKAMLGEEASLQIVAEAVNGKDLQAILSTTEADVILMDIQMPEMDGLEATRFVAEHYPSVRVLALSMVNDQKQIQEIMKAGALGYLLKTTGKQELIHAIKTVAEGTKYISTDLALNLLDNISMQGSGKSSIQVNSYSGDISEREMEVLTLIGQGLTNSEISEKLFVSRRTIESHRQLLLEKTHCNNTASLIKYAITRGLIM